jgi:hypothetical protein
MKKLITLAAALVFTAAAGLAQAPAGYTAGQITTSNNEKLDGYIKESFKGKGAISFIAAGGSKKTYSPADIKGFTLAGVQYIAYMNDFYKTIASGNKGNLYQKATDNSGKMTYNGADASPAATTDGRPGDYYLQVGLNNALNLVTKKNFETVFASHCADCAAVQSGIKAGQLDYTQIVKTVEQYNSCN